ncbi:MAG: hypothetical protein WBZ48_08835 [Bacteroidota bacterium]
MTAIRIFLCLYVFASLGCKNSNSSLVSPGKSTEQIAEGTITYFEGGGTVELQFPAGFRLDSCIWMTATPDSSSYPYLTGAVDNSYLNRYVRAYGTTSIDTFSGMFNTKAARVILNVDSLRILR